MKAAQTSKVESRVEHDFIMDAAPDSKKPGCKLQSLSGRVQESFQDWWLPTDYDSNQAANAPQLEGRLA